MLLGVGTVHPFQDAVIPGLERQVNIIADIAVPGHSVQQISGYILGMGRCKTDAL